MGNSILRSKLSLELLVLIITVFTMAFVSTNAFSKESDSNTTETKTISGYRAIQKDSGQGFLYIPVFSDGTEGEPNTVSSKLSVKKAAPVPDEFVPSLLKHRTTFEIGPEFFYDEYKEFQGGDTLMKEEGYFCGIVINSYSRPWIPESTEESFGSDKWMFGIESEFAYGKLDYDGQLQDGTPYDVSNIDDFLVDARLLAGPDFLKADSLNTFYFGIGYRYLRDDSSFDSAGYLRQSNYLYLPLGLKSETLKKDSWSLGGKAEFDLLLFGQQISTIRGIDLTNDQNSGYGLRVAVDIENISANSIFKIQPFVRYWHIDKSDLDNEYGIGVEPENETVQVGVQLIWQF